jgi:hypothetical protein
MIRTKEDMQNVLLKSRQTLIRQTEGLQHKRRMKATVMEEQKTSSTAN